MALFFCLCTRADAGLCCTLGGVWLCAAVIRHGAALGPVGARWHHYGRIGDLEVGRAGRLGTVRAFKPPQPCQTLPSAANVSPFFCTIRP